MVLLRTCIFKAFLINCIRVTLINKVAQASSVQFSDPHISLCAHHRKSSLPSPYVRPLNPALLPTPSLQCPPSCYVSTRVCGQPHKALALPWWSRSAHVKHVRSTPATSLTQCEQSPKAGLTEWCATPQALGPQWTPGLSSLVHTDLCRPGSPFGHNYQGQGLAKTQPC